MKIQPIGRLIPLILLTSFSQATEWFVAQNEQMPDPAGQFLCWQTAASNIQYAVEMASNGDIITVGPGHYRLPTNAVESGGMNVVYIDKPLTLRSSHGRNMTIIDGEGENRCIRVDYPNANTSIPFIIDGFTLSNGVATSGGGLRYNPDASSWSAYLLNSALMNNSGTDGGGIRVDRSFAPTTTWPLLVSNTVFMANEASQRGGAIRIEHSVNLSIHDSLFVSNSVTARGGAIHHERTSGRPGKVSVWNSIFYGNRQIGGGSAPRGGGVLFAYPHARIANTPNVSFVNCLMFNNSSSDGGSVVLSDRNGDIELINCTLAGNGTAINFRIEGNHVLNVLNSIVFNNGGNFSGLSGNTVTISHSLVPTEFASYGVNNVTDAPRYQNVEAQNYRLRSDSPGINAGVYQSWMDDAVDLDGNPRLDTIYGQVDMGCYEFQYRGTTILVQ